MWVAPGCCALWIYASVSSTQERGSGLKGDARSGPVYGLDATGLATGGEAVHAHGAAHSVCVRGLEKPAQRPGDVAVDVVLQQVPDSHRCCNLLRNYLRLQRSPR